MSNEIKNLIDDIIGNTHDAYPTKQEDIKRAVASSLGQSEFKNVQNKVTFDRDGVKHKISMFVLKDILSAMMNNETDNIESEIENSIERHLKENGCTSAYVYLNKACQKCQTASGLNSPIISDIIQEIDSKTDELEANVRKTKDASCCDKIDTKSILKKVENYDDFVKTMGDAVKERVVNDVARELTKDDKAPVFVDTLDNELTKTNQPTSESVIISLTTSIIKEHFDETGISMTTDEGMTKAVIGYCINQMDRLFKFDASSNIFTKYHI